MKMDNNNIITKEDLASASEIYELMIELIGFENTLKLAEVFSGETVFFKKIETLIRPGRNRKILEEFNGYNFKELGKKYGLTEIAIRDICKDHILRVRNRPGENQMSFFDNSD